MAEVSEPIYQPILPALATQDVRVDVRNLSLITSLLPSGIFHATVNPNVQVFSIQYLDLILEPSPKLSQQMLHTSPWLCCPPTFPFGGGGFCHKRGACHGFTGASLELTGATCNPPPPQCAPWSPPPPAPAPYQWLAPTSPPPQPPAGGRPLRDPPPLGFQQILCGWSYPDRFCPPPLFFSCCRLYPRHTSEGQVARSYVVRNGMNGLISPDGVSGAVGNAVGGGWQDGSAWLLSVTDAVWVRWGKGESGQAAGPADRRGAFSPPPPPPPHPHPWPTCRQRTPNLATRNHERQR